MRVYVAHVYGRRHGLSPEECEANAYKAIEVGRELIKRGHNPFIPNLFHFLHKNWESTLSEDGWFAIVSEWIRFCNILLVADMPPWEDSGVHREISIAKRLGIPVVYDIEELQNSG